MQKSYLVIAVFFSLILLIQACSKLQPAGPDDHDILDGPVVGLSGQQQQQFLDGDIAFNDEVFTTAKGLGSVFVATSCGSCHAGDGKGHPFTTLTRFGQTDSTGNQFLHAGGPQLQNRAIAGYLPEQLPQGASFAKFTAPANTGLGFIELVPDADILANSDPQDSDGDGISGVPNYGFLPPLVTAFPNAIPRNGKYIHRFGKKAATYDLLHQTVNAYNQDIGITSSFSPFDVYSGLAIDPEVSDKTIRDVVFYLQVLKAPIPRDTNDAQVIAGKNLFRLAGCESCHKQTQRTGYSPVAALSFKEFYPYTDLLLHDMGPALDDGYTEGTAKTSEWRTPALWGLGLSPNSQGGGYFLMHDGRARSIEEAIQLHGGEASASREKFNQMAQAERAALIRFLKSL
jgi:CxxC motif-containing protein (DUF1111 family)